MGQNWPLFVYFPPLPNSMTNVEQQSINGKSVDGVLGIRTQDHRMEGVYESTELWWSPNLD